MRPPIRLLRAAVLLFGIASALPARAQEIRLIASDAQGVTVRLDLPEYALVPGGEGGRSQLRIGDLGGIAVPGRPVLPLASALIALPPGARAVATVTEGGPEDVRSGVKLAISERPVFRDDAGGLGPFPATEAVRAILDGPWPASPVTLGEPFTFRRQRLAALQVQPFRYDEATGRLWSRRSITVRVEFVGGAAGPVRGALPDDRHWEPVLRGSVLNYDQGRAWRQPLPATAPRSLFATPGRTGSRGITAFDESAPEVRVRIDTTGAYGIDFDSLAAYGYPAGVPIAEVSVHRHEFVPGATPPYVTIEYPIEVDDFNTNGTFDSGDRVLVWVQSWNERSHASIPQRIWGDAEVVYVTHLPGGTGLRLPTRPGWRGTPGLTALASYPFSMRREGNFAYFPTPIDTTIDQFMWTDFSLYYDRPDTLTFAANQIDTTHQVTMVATWQGRASTGHYVWARVRNAQGLLTTVADSAYFYGPYAQTYAATLAGSAFSEGAGNALRYWAKDGSGPPDPNLNNLSKMSLDFFDVTYWRRFVALTDYLPCNSANAAGEFEILASGFTDTTVLRVWDVSDSLQPVRLTGVHATPNGLRYDVRFQDSTATGSLRRYAAFAIPKAPAAGAYGAVAAPRRQLTNRASGDYLVIAPEAFLTAVDPLVQARVAEGLDVVLAPLETVNDEFNGGRKSDYAIRRFVRYAYDHWGAKFVLLVGDGSEDPQNFIGDSGPDVIPIHKINSPVGVSNGLELLQEIVPSDPWYGWCVDCETANDFNFAPPVPELFIGRLPAKDVTQATAIVQKLVAYETVTPDQTWRQNLLLNSDDMYSDVSTFGNGQNTQNYCRKSYESAFRAINDVVERVVRDSAGLSLMHIEQFDLGYYLRNEPFIAPGPGQPDTCRPSRLDTQAHTRASVTPLLFQRLNDGQLWWNYQGHANKQVLAHEDLYVNRGFDDDVRFFDNPGKPFLFSAFSCHPNAFANISEASNSDNQGTSLGEDMVNVASGGAIASWASVGFEIIPSYPPNHLNVWFAKAMFSDPPRDPDVSDRGARVLLGEAIGKALLRNFAAVGGSSYEREVGFTYTLLGDPATRISIGAAQTVVTANGVPVTSGQPVRLHSSGSALELIADLTSNVQITTLVLERHDASGTTVIPTADYTLTPAFPDTGTSGFGGRRFHLVYDTSLTPATTRYTLRTVDRNGVPGTFDVLIPFQTVLRADGTPVNDGDGVAPGAALTLLVLSPSPLTPATDLAVTLNGVPVTFVADSVAGDHSGREWVLSWSHAPYPIGDYAVELRVGGTLAGAHAFRVTIGPNELRVENPLAFPNPFEDDLGTYFSFNLAASSAADVLVRVFTVTGRLIFERSEIGLAPGYHQLAWDGRDAEGDKLANGVYVYRLVAHNSAGSSMYEGRLVKLRKPRRVPEQTAGP